jgi:hypothetical protein
MISSLLRAWKKPVPRPATFLGAAGLVPFIAATVMLLVGAEQTDLFWRSVLLGYSVAILSFLGGVQWGLVMQHNDQRDWLRYSASVAPAIVAWIAFLLPQPAQFPILAAGFVLALIYDLSVVGRAEVPRWYRYLRWPLTIVVVACLLLAATAG